MSRRFCASAAKSCSRNMGTQAQKQILLLAVEEEKEKFCPLGSAFSVMR